MSELRGEVSRLEAEKEELERELDTQTKHTHKQVSSAECEYTSVCRLDMMCADLHTCWRVCVCVRVQVSMLQSQVQTSEALLQDLQKSFSQSQNAVQSRLVSDNDVDPTECV